MEISGVYFGILILLLTLIIIYLKKVHDSYDFFKKRDIKTPPYRFFTGNIFDYKSNKRLIKQLREWTSKYGKTYGYFEGHQPILVTSDVNMIQEIFLKQFTNFSARKQRPLDLPDDASRVSLLTAVQTRWKNMRNIINPTFSSSKLRELNPILMKCVERLDVVFNDNLNKKVEIKEILKRFTMDSIWNSAFGIDINLQKSDQNINILKTTDQAIDSIFTFTIMMYISAFFHEFRRYISNMYWFFQILLYKIFSKLNGPCLNPLLWIRENSIKIVENRLNNEVDLKRRDYLALLLEAYTDNINELQKIEKFDAETTQLKKKLSIEEIKMNLAVFIVGGYDTVATTLSHCLYTMAYYPEEQKKLVAEIEEYFPHDSNVEPNVDNVKQLEYMKCFINEILRCYPVANLAINRRCVHSTVVNGIDIPKGLIIQIDAQSLHRDQELWGPVDPEVFYPERFSKENKRNPFAFMGFGAGPRNCIGMKYAFAEMQIALVNLLRKFEFDLPNDCINELKFTDFEIISRNYEVNLVIKKRIA